MYYQQTDDKPCAYITKNKQRIKQFGQNVYLKDGSEFEIELYNPSRKTVLSKIKINGEFINGGGIILRPGERVFLERYIDVPRKFKFETYTVDPTNETMNAIANNGNVEILFYNEQEIIATLTYPNITYGSTTYPNTTYASTTNTVSRNMSLDESLNIFHNTSLSNSGLNLTSFSNNATPRSSKYEKREKPERRLKSKSVETGRVEKGSSSDQEFKTVSKNFNSCVVSTSVWKILPESQKPVEKSDLINKCPKCSTKLKKSSWKFCPECGNQLVRSKTEIHYTMDSHVSINGRNYMMSTYNDTLDNFLKRYESKLIYIKSDSLTPNSLRAVVID
jgi:DNA-directed RNA polymerase subunit M/transcription elongation factor TFIIS